MEQLETLAYFLKLQFPNDAHMPDLQVEAANSSAACPVGTMMMVGHGEGSELERTVCSKKATEKRAL